MSKLILLQCLVVGVVGVFSLAAPAFGVLREINHKLEELRAGAHCVEPQGVYGGLYADQRQP